MSDLIGQIFLIGLIFSPILYLDNLILYVRKKHRHTPRKTRASNKAWLAQNINWIRENFENQFVALYNSDIIDNDENLQILKDRIRLRELKLKKVYFHFVKSKEQAKLYKKFE